MVLETQKIGNGRASEIKKFCRYNAKGTQKGPQKIHKRAPNKKNLENRDLRGRSAPNKTKKSHKWTHSRGEQNPYGSNGNENPRDLCHKRENSQDFQHKRGI